jgi:hypothetical protein
MSILDDAIREHLELKRAHGADDSELKKLEDEAFGPPQRPDEADPFAEAPTEFLTQPGEAPAPPAERGRPDIADLQEAPPADAGPAAMPPPTTGEVDELSPTPDAPPPSPADAADVPLPPPPAEAPAADLAPPPGEAPAPPSDEPTSGFFDQFSSPAPAPAEDAASAWTAPAPPSDEAPLPTDEAAVPAPTTDETPLPTDVPGSPSDEASLPLADAPATDETPLPTDEAAIPTDAPAAPISEETPLPTDESPVPTDVSAPPTDEAPLPADEAPVADAGPGTEERHAIADQPTQMFDVQAHVDAEAAEEAPAPEAYEQQPLDIRGPDAEVAGHPPAEADAEEGSAEFDFFNEQRLSDELDQALEAPLPPTEEHLAMPQYQDAPSEEQGGVFDFQGGGAPAPAPAEEEDEDERDYDPETGHEDVLEDTPRFLEDQGDDDLWFEQKPPKDFDLD